MTTNVKPVILEGILSNCVMHSKCAVQLVLLGSKRWNMYTVLHYETGK